MNEAASMDRVELDRLVAQVAASRVLGIDGSSSRLRDYWREQPTVTAFVRHYGCLFCHEMVGAVVDSIPRIMDRGARIVIVGNGSVNQARHFFSEKQLPRSGVSVLTDPGRESFQAAGFERGVLRTFTPGSVRAFGRAREGGHNVTGLFGDLTQLGGTFVVHPPAHATYLHRSKFAGDHPDMDALISAL